MTSRIDLKGASVWDGTGKDAFVADVAVQGNRIKAVGTDVDAAGADVIDAAGMTLMPGLVEGHCHLSFASP